MTILSRRRFLASAGAALAATRLDARAPGDRLSTLAVLDAEVRRITSALGGEARTERLGSSRGGRPIDLISIGRGSRSILLIGAPHPNEPIGLLTVLRLMERLSSDRALRQDGGYSFHFIPAIDVDGAALNEGWIDVDGAALNEGWIDAPLAPETYLHHFFRPAFALQPEYSFPLAMPGYRFDAPTPENICWQVALEHTRPMLQCSLHGSDNGGVFYFITERHQGIADRLTGLPEKYGLAINAVGEAGLGSISYAPGVLSEFDVKAMVEKALAAGKDVAGVWSAGQSSSAFARERHGSFSLTCEVALWNDRRLYSARLSGTTMADVARETLIQLREDEALLALPLHAFGSPEAAALDASLEEARNAIGGRMEAMAEEAKAGDLRLSERDLVQYEPGLAAVRTVAMLARRARLSGDAAVAAQAEAVVTRRIGAQRAKAPLTPIPYRDSADLQIEATLIAADALGR